MSEENKRIARRLPEEAFGEGKIDLIDEFVASEFVNHDPATPPELPSGPEGMKAIVSMYRTAFPDVRITIEDQIAEGDTVASRWTARGTHKGELMGIPPTDREVTITGISIDRLSGGKIAESWTNWDALGMLQQIGAVPEPETARV